MLMTKKNSNYTQECRMQNEHPLAHLLTMRLRVTKMMNCHFQFLLTIAFTYVLL